jgi:hypothetical protein
MIETLDDIIEQIADRLGIYGACHDSYPSETRACPCRCCFTSSLASRIRAAVEVERKLSA